MKQAMPRHATIVPERRSYNQWAAALSDNDHAHRRTPPAAYRWSAMLVLGAATASGASLVYEAIGAIITLLYGSGVTIAAILCGCAIMFVTGLPIAVESARRGIDIDLITRGAGFGYLGSTITSLIYASFTFLLFAIEASIMAVALQALTGVNVEIAFILCTAVVLPVAHHGMRVIARFQTWTQPVWIALQMVPVSYVVFKGDAVVDTWQSFTGLYAPRTDVVSFGLALSVLLSLLPRIGEQADYLRFLPKREVIGARRWWAAVVIGGPGWALIGGAKMLLGSILAAWAVRTGMTADLAETAVGLFGEPFRAVGGQEGTLLLVAMMAAVCQVKVNVTNAYAGSIAWSNVFSRLTHRYSGRAVWLLFHAGLATMLLFFGVTRSMETVLLLYSSLAASWIGALCADLLVSRPLGLAPARGEFQRAYLYDVNPAGTGAMLLSLVASAVCQLGFWGEVAQAFSPVIGLCVAFVAAPLIAGATRGQWYVAVR